MRPFQMRLNQMVEIGPADWTQLGDRLEQFFQ
jgi:hypothetical protein